MEQLIGSSCVGCQQNITNVMHAENCLGCGNAIHTACIRPMEAGDSLEVCHRCGYAKAGAAQAQYLPGEQAAPAAGQQTALLVIGTIITIIGVVLLVGNVSGWFRTFPFAGFLVIMIGGAIAGAGKRS